MLKLFLPFCVIFSGVQAQDSLPSPYESVELLPFDCPGWYSNGPQLEALFQKHRPNVVIEVGSWAGRSTLHMASLLEEGGMLYAVDHWLGSIEHQVGQWAYSPILHHLYEQFLSNVIHSKLTDKIVPIRMSSLDASQYLTNILEQVDLVYIDASHDTDAVLADIKSYYPLIQGHGVICGDDWSWDSVRKAVEIFAQDQRLNISSEGNFWVLQ